MAAQEGSSGKKHQFKAYNDKELETLIKSIRVYDEEPSSFIGLFKAIYKRDPNTEEMLDYLDSKNINETYSQGLCSGEPKVHLSGGDPTCYHCEDLYKKHWEIDPKYDLDSPEEIPEKIPEKIYGNVNDDCSICYDEPSTEILPCGHRYGKNCIPQLINRYNSKCQLCKKPFTMDEVLTDPNAPIALAKAKQKALEEQKKALEEQKKALEKQKALAKQKAPEEKKVLAEQQARTGLYANVMSLFGYGGGKKTRRRRQNKKMTRKNKTKRATKKSKAKKSLKNKSKRK